MMSEQQSGYKQVAVGESNADAVTVGIEAGANGSPKAAVWWEAKGDVDADEAEYDNVTDQSESFDRSLMVSAPRAVGE